MTQTEIKALASEIIGDGQTPNKFFVTTSPYVMLHREDWGDQQQELIDGFYETDSWTQVFDTYEEANDYFQEIELDVNDGVGQVVMEDRLTGTIKENFLEKVIRTDYSLSGYDDAKQFGYEK